MTLRSLSFIKEEFREKLNKELRSLPEKPGIYKMLGDRGGVLYIGKAKNLKKRVRSYFSGSNKKDPKTKALVTRIRSFEYIITKTENEALILENQLIKKETPKYNILLRDDKSYPYIKISKKAPYPRLLIARERKNDSAYYFGPYPSIGSTKYLVKLLVDLFPIRDCKQSIDIKKKQPKCMKLDIGKCIGPCIYKEKKDEYDQLIKNLICLLKGQNKNVLKLIEKKMAIASENRRYEIAASYRDQILKINQLIEKQRVSFNENFNAIICTVVDSEQYSYVLCRTIISGQLLYQKGFYIEKDKASNQWISQVVQEVDFMTEVKKGDLICDEKCFNALKLIPTSDHLKLVFPKRGVKYELLKIATTNATIALKKIELDHQHHNNVSKKNNEDNIKIKNQLMKLCKLKTVPNIIIGVDISHLQGTNIIGSSVCFKNGESLKSEYRYYNLKTIYNKSNDPECIYEVVKRRAKSFYKQNQVYPDLFLIDGGLAQLNFAKRALQEVGASSECISIAKKDEIIFYKESDQLKLNKYNKVRLFVQRVRDEAHRFGVTAQRKKRKISALHSLLDSINGLGEVRIEALYKKYKTISIIKQQSLEELKKVGRIGHKLAEKIKKTLKQS